MAQAISYADIAIIGGGLTGKMMSLALLQSGYEICLFAPEAAQKKPDRRTTTIHAAGYKMLTALGVIDHLATPMVPIHSINVAIGPEAKHQSDWLLNWHETPNQMGQIEPMAYVVENHHLDSAFDKALKANPFFDNLTIIKKTISAFEDKAENASLYDDEGQAYHVRLVVACDGARSVMRDLAGIKPREEITNQKAVITNLTLETDHDFRACQRFLETGPIALMPLDGKMASMVWSTSEAEADRLINLDDDDFAQEVTSAFGLEFGNLRPAGDRHSFALRPYFNRHLSKGRLMLAGDAAHAIHPLAGMGYNLALADAAILLDELKIAKKRGLLPDHISIKNNYAKRRQPEIIAMSAATSYLNKALSRSPNSMISRMMATGMILFDKTALKHMISQIAKGGKLAKAPLLKGEI